MTSDLDDLLAFATDMALQAGKIQLDGLSRAPRVSRKSKKELVTPIDHACEDYIIKRIQAAYPDHGYFAEEGHQAEGEVRWIVDPIDGTTNFAHRLPLFCVSIGLAVAGSPVLGVVYAPYTRELFSGRQGGGAVCRIGDAEPQPMTVSTTTTVEDALLATGFAYVQNETANNNLGNWTRIKQSSRGMRRGGSAALDLAYVADGRFDGFWEMHLKPYDVAAGAVLIREAGGRVSDMRLGDDWLEGQTILATNGHLHTPLHNLLDPVEDDGWIHKESPAAE